MKNFIMIVGAVSLFGIGLLSTGCNNSGDNTANSDSTGVRGSSSTTTTTTTTSKTVQVSPTVQNSFAKSYPTVQNVEWVKYEPVPEFEPSDWEMLGWNTPDTSDFAANFVEDSMKYTSWYTPQGDLIGSMAVVDSTNLPALVNTSLHTQYVDYNIGSVIKIKDKKGTGYKIKLNNGKDKVKILVDENGKILKVKK